MTVSSGVATFTNISHQVAGNITITFTSGSLSSVTSSSVAIAPAAADHLVFVSQPGSATAGAAFGAQPSLVSEDQFGNASAVGLPSSLNVSVALTSGAGALQGTTTQDIGTAAGNGTVTFTNLRIDVAGTDKQLTASASGLTSASSSVFTVNHAAAAALTIQQQPSSTATAGVAFAQQPIVRIRDAFGNLVDDDNATVITAARNAGAGTLQGTVIATASGGVASFANLSHNVAGTITVLFTSGALSAVESASILVSPAAANHLVFVAQPGSATAGSIFGSQPSVKSKDAFGNDSAAGLPPSLSVTMSLTAGTGPLQGTVTQDIGTGAGNGLVSFTNLRIDSAGNDKQLSAAASGLSSGSSSVFVVNHAAASQLAIQTQPSSTAVAGQLFAQQPVIEIEDQFGNLISEDSATTVTAARNSGSGTLQGTLTLTASNGTVTYTNLSHNVAGNITIAFSATGLTATNSNTVTITPAAADHLIFVSQPGSATAGAVFGSQPSLVAQDAFGNNSSVGLPAHLNLTMSLIAGSGPLQGTTTRDIGTAAGNGSASFSDLRIDVAGNNKQLSASASSLTGVSSSVFTVAHAAASTLTIQQQPSSSATAGVAFTQQPTVRIEDGFGNLITEDNSTVITATRNAGSGTLQGALNVTAVGGVATFANLSHNVANTITITFSSGSLTTVTSTTINVSSASASKLAILTQPGATAVAGQAFLPQPRVAIEDQFNNVVTSDNSSLVVVTRTFGGALQGTLSATAASGVATFANLSETEATTMTLDFTSGSLTGARSSSITISSAAADHLAIATQPSSVATAGTAFATQPVIQIQDQYNNVVTSDNSSVVTAVRSSGAGTLQGTTSLTTSSGLVTFANLFHTFAGNITILFSSGSLTTAISSSVQVNPANANHLLFTTQPSSATAGSAFGVQPVVRSYDTYGNASTSGLGSSLPVSMTLQSGMGPLQGTTTLDIGTANGNGTVSFTNLRIDAAGTGKQ
ncbi:MAG: beta strand repeat-containing protein, partial [Limisphaerales bacterium]